MSEKDYIPYGDEWKKDMMKLTKEELINLYADLAQKVDELIRKYKDS